MGPLMSRVYAPRPPLAGRKGCKAGGADACAAGLKDFIAQKMLCKRPLIANSAAGARQQSQSPVRSVLSICMGSGTRRQACPGSIMHTCI